MTDDIDEGKAREEAERKAEEDSLRVDVVQKICLRATPAQADH